MKKCIMVLMLILAISLFLFSNKSFAKVNIYSDGYPIASTSSSKVYYSAQNRQLMETPYVSATVYTPNDSSVSAKIYLEDYPYDYKEYLVESVYPFEHPFMDAELLEWPTTRYNCHSYAWHSQDVSSNIYWIPYPTNYYTDYSYYEVSSPRAGDIICYFDNNGTPSNYSDDENLHSGIVSSVNDNQVNNICGTSSLVNVTSKWGSHGLFEHRGDQCPYTSAYNGDADYVRYYRPRTNSTYSSPSSTLINETLVANGSGNIIEKYEMYELNANSYYHEFTVSSNYPLEVRLYDEHMQIVSTNQTITGTYTNSFTKYLSSGRYYLRVAYQNTSNSGTIYTTISHSHSYDDHYQQISLTEHKSYCLCNNYTINPHIVSPDAFQNGDLYAICLLCHGFASIGETYHEGIGNYPYTLNGSFILPNGVIVLDEDDMESYLNGTLVFIDPNADIVKNNLIPCLINKKELYCVK